MIRVEKFAIPISVDVTVSAILSSPSEPKACFVVAHGAGAGMTHAFMTAVADGLAEREIAVLRFNFPYMELGSKRPDRPAVAHAAIRSAVDEANRLFPSMSLFAGGKSFGARMTSQAQALAPLPGVRGLAFLGFPLHPANKPSDERARHLSQVRVPMLFLQGTKDALADMSLLKPLVGRLAPLATLHSFEGADHSFHVARRSGRTDADLLAEVLDVLVAWVGVHSATA